MAVTITHSTPADGTFSATGAAAWDASHSVSGLGTMAEQNSNNVNITGGSITGVTGVLTGLTVNSTPTSGGAAGQIMFDTGSVLQESSNLVWDNTAKRLTLTGYSLTGTSALSQLDLSGTWNTSGTPTAILLNVIDTASNAASLLMDLQIGSASKFKVSKTGGITVSTASINADTANTLFLGAFATYIGGGGYGRIALFSDRAYTWSTATNNFTANDLFLTRRGAANLRLGLADAAAPVAQTLSVQSVVAGTSNTAGANLTITGSQGTGTGAGGSIIFQVAPAGSSGTAQNALTTALTIAPTGNQVTVGGTLGSSIFNGGFASNLPYIGITGTNSRFAIESTTTAGGINSYLNTGAALSASVNLAAINIGGSNTGASVVNAVAITATTTETWSGAVAGTRLSFNVNATGALGRTERLAIEGNGLISFGGSTSSFPALKRSSAALQVRLADDSAYAQLDALTYTLSTDVLLTRRGAANLRLGAADAAAPVAQTLSVQSVVAGTSNTAGANLTITGSQGTGTGAGGSIIFQVAPAGSSGTAQNALATAFTIASTGLVSAGTLTSAALTAAGGTPTFGVSANPARVVFENTAPSSSGSGGILGLYENDGGAMVSGDRLGIAFFGGSSSASALRNTAAFAAYASENWVDASAYGTRFAFEVNANGATSRTERFAIEGNGLVSFGGSTSSFPALKRSTTILQVRLADDSAYAPVEASTVRTATAYTVATLPAAGTAGRRAYVTDATAPTFLGALIGGGTVVCPVFDDGTAWVAG